MIPLGGGNEIGASAYLYFIGGRKILIDYGIRFNNKESFPDLEFLKSLAPEIDAIIITHAHIDHCGAFHIASSLYPDTPVITTFETAELLSLMVEDAIKVRYIGREEESFTEYKLFDEAFLRIERKDFFEPFTFGDIEITLFPAGHILGAASVLFKWDGKSLYHTGDISLKDQFTVKGAVLPDEKVNFLVMESTYYYTDRDGGDETSLVEGVKEIVERKGKILIPVFALGRAQEIISILKEGMMKGEIPPINVYVDGLAREVCNIYEHNIDKEFFNFYIQPAPFYEGLSYEEACEENLREADCIIATSGMLMENTPSYIYGKLIGKRANNGIIFSGYLSEESFGYRLLKEKKKLKNFKCQILKHHLSAHGSGKDLRMIESVLSPDKVILVHGYPSKEKRIRHAANREVVYL
ncbi:RNA processing exonuclease, beta-lactamase fold, Cft2 family [Desulfurobacterium atlanticum]|uniref:RNA processing exonuclease, beta-lactamase fold, Cft2 family n=2 Tax=Desulfurobacterium atlanticum TaxID=240169 RepID=A0A238XPX9_9BACT|nr:RNA processing exonuclease, beta-lactamase fold, Cft2 family [Desulfurobacterium atlanticum]